MYFPTKRVYYNNTIIITIKWVNDTLDYLIIKYNNNRYEDIFNVYGGIIVRNV